ncbi:SDR family NAD(P)-dependent oxidoreductase [Streptomyces sp. GC420]|uniref:SDR family NAD(P)-dependent oxidoreductase n=1 Tax=Streptomyces sp. GC420 TaxID=2697568 RepID=UPI001414ED87|nr:glucose 1-dehydrogenase [Streptomyces sp. GC420]NBM17765.1 glucose 1-dehydrogenase [Streptomyces sp. GC420]
MGKLDGRVVVITGAARGQGEQEARLFVAEGARVLLGDVLDDRGEALAKELGEDVAKYVRLDVSREEDWSAAVAAAEENFGGKVDGLVNNAGILRFNELVSTPLEEFLEVVRVNQVGVFLGMRACAPGIRAAGGGTIVNTASYTALSGMTLLTSYAATKAAIVGMTRVAALELAPHGIRVNAMCPGAVDTPMTSAAALDPALDTPETAAAVEELYRRIVPLGRIGRPEEVAALALFLTSADSSYITGQPFVVDGGWLAGVSLG